MASQTSTNTLGYVSFLNLFGILISIVLCILFIILGGHTLKYIKAFACKIKIIVNKAEDKNTQVKDLANETPKPTLKNPAFTKIEAIYKNEIKKSRSLQYWMIVRNLIAKYDHIVYYPFRDKIMEQYDLLKPKTTFYTLLVICTCCIAWMTTIFLTAILQNSYSNVTLIPTGTFVGLTIAIAIISSFLNLITTNRLFRIYLVNLKNAFKVDYGHKFLDLDRGLQDYEPENSMEEEELFRHQKSLANLEVMYDDDEKSGTKVNPLLQSELTQRTLMLREETLMNSTRKLLNEDFERSEKVKQLQSIIEEANNLKSIIEESKFEDEEHESFEKSQKFKVQKRKVKGKAIKDLFDLQVGIDGLDEAEQDEKYIFVEDKHAIGDMDLLYNEAEKGENKSNLYTFIVLFIIIALAAMFCCYLNYTFHSKLAEAVFYMFIGSFFGDILVMRPALLMLIALFKFCDAKRKGYRPLQYQDTKQVRDQLNNAIKDMFATRKKMKEENEKNSARGSGDQKHLTLPKHQKGKSNDSLMGVDGYMTQNGIDRQDTSMKQFPNFEDEKEDDMAQEVHDRRNDDDDFDGPKGAPNLNFKSSFHPTEFARPKIEDDQKKAFENSSMQTQTMAYHTKIPLLNTMQQAINEKEQKEFQDVVQKKQLHNELVDYNLLLLRKIFDGYEERAEKVLRHFRSDNNEVLRKRYMVPILNPNYDYEKLLKEMQDAGKGAKDKVEEDPVHLDGQTVAGDLEKEVMDAVIQEASDDLVPKKVDRQKIDKFGNPVDEDKAKNGVTKACPQPAFGEIEHSAEENMEEDDEEARKKSELERLKQKLANGEELTAEELARLEQLENDRLNDLEKLISQMLSKGFDNLTDEEKMLLFMLQKEKYTILLEQMSRKKNKSNADKLRIQQLEEQLRRLELEMLKLKEKLYGLTDEEKRKLEMLEQERLTQIKRRISELMKKGWENLTEQERLELLGLQQEALNIELDQLKRKNPPLSEEDLKRMQQIEDELKKRKLQELLLKEQMGTITDEERRLLKQLQSEQDILDQQSKAAHEEALRKQREEEEENLRRQREVEEESLRQKQKAEEDALRLKEIDELEQLRQKLLNGEITEEKLRRLRELEAKYGLEEMKDPFADQKMMGQDVDDNMNLSKISDQDNFSELPPVQVLNNLSKPQSPDQQQRLTQEEEDKKKQEEQQRLEEQEKLLAQQKLQEQEDLEAQQNLKDRGQIYSLTQLGRGLSLWRENTFFVNSQCDEEKEDQQLLEDQQKMTDQQLLKDQQTLEEQQRLEQQQLLQEQQKQEEEKQRQEEQKRLEDQQKFEQEQQKLLDEQKLQEQQLQKLQEEEQRLKDEQALKEAEEQRKLEELAEQEQALREQEEAQRQRNQEAEEQLRQEQEKLLEQQRLLQQQEGLTDEERLLEEQKLQEQQRLLDEQQQLAEQQRLLDEQNLFQQQQELEEQQRMLEQERLEEQQRFEEQQKELERQKEEEQRKLQEQQQKLEEQQRQEEQRRMEEQQSIEEKKKLDDQRKAEEQKRLEEEQLKQAEQQKLMEQKKLEEDQRKQQEAEQQRLKSQQESERKKAHLHDENDAAAAADSADEENQRKSRVGTRDQNKNQLDEDDYMRNGNPNKLLDNDLGFNHDDLENGDGGQEESIYSHKTTTILDEEKVSFMHIEQLPNQDNASDDSFAEQDMVYYNKDDLTNYSKGLGLNKVKARNPMGQQYFSENDLQEVREGDMSDNESLGGRSRGSGMSLDHTGQRRGYGRGHLSHRDLEMQEYDDFIDGRKKVDSWNLNYKGKKKKLKKKKVTENQKKKMNDLQNIYGVDAKTLAGLSKGRLPRQLLAEGKLKGDESMGHHSRLVSDAEDPFRSTQNTFMNKMATPDARLKQSVNDAQSNMFSMNGFGATRQGWNDGGMKKGPIDSRNQFGASQLDNRSNKPSYRNKKLTSTQQEFSKKQGRKAGRGNGYPDEESKSINSGNSLNNKFKSNSKKKGNKGSTGKKGYQDDGVDSHTESDEAVDDRGALFQKRNGPYDFMKQGRGFGDANDLDHSESEEGNNQDNPNFDGNEFAFRKRQPGESGARLNKDNMKSKKVHGQKNSMNFRGSARGSGSDLDVEDLEAQQVTTGKKGGKIGMKQSTNKKANGFMRGSSAEREDSEEENLGGTVKFQQRNAKEDYIFGGDTEGYGGSPHKVDVSGIKQNGSNTKPPLSNRKGQSRGRQGETEELKNHIYGNPYSIGSRVHPGVSEKFRASHGFNDTSDNKRNMRGSKYSQTHHHDSDGEVMTASIKKKSGRLDGNMSGIHNRNSYPNLLDINYNGRSSQNKFGKKMNGGSAHQSDDEDDYIVGPESNHSSIKKRPFGVKNNQAMLDNNEDDEQYLLLQRERQIVEDIESENGSVNRLAKKRKIRKAAHSQNPKDLQARRQQELQMERLRKRQREAESALFAKDDDLEAGKAKMKKKKVKKEFVRKEINYWLDYDSPYTEFLPARFKEWSPNPNQPRVSYDSSQHCFQGPSAANQKRQGQPLQNKYSEVLNVYSKANDHARQGSSKQNSRSRERSHNIGGGRSGGMLNVIQQKPNGQPFSKQLIQDANTLFVDDYESDGMMEP